MAEQRSDNMTAEMEEEGLTILQKIEDMEVYALPLIERWSIAHQKLLGYSSLYEQNVAAGVGINGCILQENFHQRTG